MEGIDDSQFVSTTRNQQKIVITFYKHYYCDELKRLVSLNVMPVTVIHDELASSTSTNLYTVGYFPTWDQDRYIMYGTTTGPF
ncbi:hypothetical protein T08_8381 [Trichinella sp. T8]|nr:hypothetical protein T08_8381 [Trichinella sp. T8]